MTQNPAQTLKTIRDQVEYELGSQLPDSIWGYLEGIGRVGAVETGDEDIHWLANEIRKLQSASGSPEKGVKAPVVLAYDEDWGTEETSPDTTKLREHAVSLLLAKEAGKDPSVLDFRNKYLGGETLPHAEVEGWLKRQAVQDSSNQDEELSKHFVSHIRSRPQLRLIEYSVPNEPWRRIQPVSPGGVLEELWKLVRHMKGIYNPWSEGQAAMFVLTGLIPQIKAVEDHVDFNATIEANTRVTLVIDPAVTPQELAEIYAKVRSGISSTRIRSLSPKHLRLAILCTASSDKDTWDQKMQRWNETYPEVDYPGYPYDDRRAFHRDAVQVCERLLHPPYSPHL